MCICRFCNISRRVPKTTAEQIPDNFYKYYAKYQNNELNKSELSKITGILYPTIYKYNIKK